MSDIVGPLVASILLVGICGNIIMKPLERIWHEGFTAGERYLNDCPYLTSSNEASAWHAGWIEGMLKSHGCAYRDKPSGFEGDELMNGLIRW